MQTTRVHVDKLLAELQKAVKTILAEGQPEFDWSEWIRNVEGLRAQLSVNLEKCEGKFSSDTSSVGDFATQQQINDSVQSLRQRIF